MMPFDNQFNVQYPAPSPPPLADQNSAAKRYARARMLSGIAGGLGAGIQPGGFLGNFSRAFSGAVGAGTQEGHLQQEEQRRAAEQALATQTAQQNYQHQISQDANDFERLLLERRKVAVDEAKQPQTMTELQYYLKDPKGFAAFKAAGRSPEDNGDVAISPEARDMLARVGLTTGSWPHFRGKNAAQNQAAIFDTAAHLPGGKNIALNSADYKANLSSYREVAKRYHNISSFENTAVANADKILLKAIEKVPDTGTQFGNHVRRLAAAQLGSKGMASYNAARQAVKAEFTRLLQSANASGVISDTARREMEDSIGEDFTRDQMKAAIETLKAEAHNRRVATSDEMIRLRELIGFDPTADQSTNPNNDLSGSSKDPLGLFK